MHEENMETIEIQIDADLLDQLLAVITPMGLTPEQLMLSFFEWCVSPDTRDEAMAWLLKCKEEYRYAE